MRRLAIGLSGVCISLIGLLAFLTAAPPALSAEAAPAAGCGAVSCTVYLPIIFRPAPLLPAQFEVTQGVQQPDNSVLLIASRPTYVRWTLTATVAYTNVNALLYGTRGGVPLPGSPLSATNGSRTLQPTADRSVLNDTFNFRLPASWSSGNVVLGAQASNSTGFLAHTISAGFYFNPSAALQVKVVPIAYQCTNGGNLTLPSDPPYSYLTPFTYRVYPVPSITLSVHASISYSGPCTNGLPDPTYHPDWDNMLNAVTGVWQAEGSPNIYYYGLLGEIYCGGPDGCIAGVGWVGNYKAAVGYDGGPQHDSASRIHAHEVGHNHGLDHPSCSGSGGAYPYLRANIGNDTHQNFGFNIDTLEVYSYLRYRDFMAYCDPQWTSDYTYKVIWNYDNVMQALRSTQPGGDRAFLISGEIDPVTDRVSFGPAYAMDTPARLPERGDYTLEMLDQTDRVLAAYAFTPTYAQPDHLDNVPLDSEVIGFHLTLPYVDRVASLRVRHGVRIIGALTASAVSPRLIAVIRPAQAGPGNSVRWIGYAGDGNSLSYLVRASTDHGKTWQTIGVNLAIPAITLRPEEFGGQQVLLEVLGSDGLNTSKLLMGPYSVEKE